MDPFDTYVLIWDISEKLGIHYDEFWRRIYYDDSYVFYKNAIMFYKNVQNGKYHHFFSGIINESVYRDSCKIIPDDRKQDFISDDKSLALPSSDSLCNLSGTVINTLDTVFRICPKVPFNLVTYRYELRPKDDEIFNLKKGDFYHNNGIMSTTINPWYTFGKYFVMMPREKIYISYTILIPKYISACYFNIPFGLDLAGKIYTGSDEFELLLPRNCVFEVLNRKNYNNIVTFELILRYQNDHFD